MAIIKPRTKKSMVIQIQAAWKTFNYILFVFFISSFQASSAFSNCWLSPGLHKNSSGELVAISMVTANSADSSSLDLAKAQAALQAKRLIYASVGKRNELKRTYINSYCVDGFNVWAIIKFRFPETK